MPEFERAVGRILPQRILNIWEQVYPSEVQGERTVLAAYLFILQDRPHVGFFRAAAILLVNL